MIKYGTFKVDFEVGNVKMNEEIECVYRSEEWNGYSRMKYTNLHIQEAHRILRRMLGKDSFGLTIKRMYKTTPFEMIK